MSAPPPALTESSPAVDALLADLGPLLTNLGASITGAWPEGGELVVFVEAPPFGRLQLRFAPADSDVIAFATGPDLRFYYHFKPDGPPEASRDKASTAEPEAVQALVRSTGQLVASPGHDALSAFLAARTLDIRTVRRAQLPWLVARGHKPTAIVVVGPNELRRDRWRSEVPHGLYSRFDIVEDRRGKILTRKSGEGDSRFLYCAQTASDAARLRDLDEAILHPHTRRAPPADRLRELRREQCLLLGFPPCCVARFVGAHTRVARWDEAWLRLPEPPPTRGAPETAFVAALVYGLAFFAHTPCSPSCEPTIAANAGLLDTLFDPGTRDRLRELLSTGFVVWPSGRLAIFRPTTRNGDWLTLAPGSLSQVLLPELVGPRYAEALRRPLLGSAEEDATVTALRVQAGILEVATPYGIRPVVDPARGLLSRPPGPRIAWHGAQGKDCA